MSWDASRYHGPDARKWELADREAVAGYSPGKDPEPRDKRADAIALAVLKIVRQAA